MDFNWIWICQHQIQPRFLKEASQSEPDKVHTTVGKTLFNDSFCTCKGFEFRGYCRHTLASDESYCSWWTLGENSRPKKCPECGGNVIPFTFDLEFDE